MSWSTLKRRTPLKSNGCGLRRTPFKRKPVAWSSAAVEKKAVSARKTGNTAKKASKADLVERLDRVFSLYIRLRDAMDGGRCVCISCGRQFPFEQMQCGHYIRRAVMATRFDPLNCWGQCPECNCHKAGNLTEYRRNLVQKIGAENFEELLALSRTTRKWGESELKDAIRFYTKEAKRLSAEKGIHVNI